MIRRIITYLAMVLATASASFATIDPQAPISPLSEDATISLLTSGPSDMAIFTVWGHTAIRVKDPATSTDKVFNYGIFSFGEPLSFISRFVSGQTDYKLGRTSMYNSMEETIEKNADYYEQVLNLTQHEKEVLYGALLENYKPENRVYRYKYFSDNCATRPRALLRKCIEGELVYGPFTEEKAKAEYDATYNRLYKNEDGTDKTYRDIIYELLPTSPWYRFGIDLCLGQPTDTKIGDWDQLFLPIYLKEEVSYQSIKTQDSIRPLVAQTNQLLTKHVEADNEDTEWTNIFSPLIVFWTAVLFALLHIMYYKATGKDDRWAYVAFFALLGLFGIIVFYVSCLSVHEFVSPNLNLLWMSPIQFLIAVLIYAKKAQKIEKVLMWIACIGSALAAIYFVVCKLSGSSLGEVQQYNTANLPIIIIELLFTAAWLYKNRNRAQKLDKR